MSSLNYPYDKKRFEAFIDAIVAIILTILVLELRIPETDHAHELSTQKQVASLLHAFVSYIGSFLLIVGIWIDHHTLFLYLQKLTKSYMLLNMLFILSLSIVPFTTAFAGSHSDDSFAVALLFVNYVIMNLIFGSLYWYADWKKLLDHEFLLANRNTGIYSLVGITGLIVAIPVAYFNTYISFCIGIIIFSGHLLKKTL